MINRALSSLCWMPPLLGALAGCGSNSASSDAPTPSQTQGGAAGNGAVGGSGGQSEGGGASGMGHGGKGSGMPPGPVPSGCTATSTAGIAHPFGSHGSKYAQGSILPSGAPAALDAATSAFYQKWKSIYVDPTSCSEGAHIVFHKYIHGRDATVSEAMGYGMVILPLMAGCDPDAQTLYDSMHAFVTAHTNANGLLIWKQEPNKAGGACSDGATDTATDGDLDVAFSYLLADAQWGSAGSVNYLGEATKRIAAIQAHEIVSGTHVTNLGDSAGEDTTRPSDWMLDHFRSFAKIDPFWTQAIDETYQIADHVQTQFSPSTGLIPDYIINVGSAPSPAAAGTEVQESSFTDSEVAYNSCRVPWHLGTDFLVSGDARAKKAADAINGWIKTATGGDPTKIIDGYKLDGSEGSLDPADFAPDPPTHGGSLAFSAPLAVCAMTDASNQVWLDALWDFVAVQHAEVDQGDDYYGNTIKMLNMIIMSGNWWSPIQ